MHGDDVNRQQHYSKTGGHTQAASVAEQLFNLFVGNERRHIKNCGPPVRDPKIDKKYKLDVKTHDGSATLGCEIQWNADSDSSARRTAIR
jgi:hypothetical protein